MFHPDDPDYQDHKNEPENIDSELEVIHSLARVMIFDVKNSLPHFEHFERRQSNSKKIISHFLFYFKNHHLRDCSRNLEFASSPIEQKYSNNHECFKIKQ